MNVEMSVVVQLIGYALLAIQPFEYSPAQAPGERSGTFEVFGKGTQAGKPIETYRLQSGDLVIEARDAGDLGAPSVTLIEARQGDRRYVWVESDARYALQLRAEEPNSEPSVWLDETRVILGRTTQRRIGGGWTHWVDRKTDLVLSASRGSYAWTAERIETRETPTTLAHYGLPGRILLRGPYKADILWRIHDQRARDYEEDTASARRRSNLWQGAWVGQLSVDERMKYLGSAFAEKVVTRQVPTYRPGPVAFDTAGLPEGTQVEIRLEGETLICAMKGPNFAPTVSVHPPWVGDGGFHVLSATVDDSGRQTTRYEIYGRPVLLADGTLFMGFGRTAEEARARTEARVAISYGESATFRCDWADPKTGETLTVIQEVPNKPSFWPEGFAPTDPPRSVNVNGTVWQVAEADGYRMATHTALGRRVILGSSHLSVEDLVKLWPAKPE